MPQRFLPFALALGAGLFAASPAWAASVELQNGTKVDAEQVFYTYTHLIAVTSGGNLSLYLNGEVKSVDGKPFAQAYWEEKPITVETIEGTVSGSSARGMLPEGAWPMRTGTTRRYKLEKTQTTWVRHGVEMQRRGTVTGTGNVVEAVDGATGGGRVTFTETIDERVDGKPPRQVRLTDQIEPRPDGYYLMAQRMEDDALRTPRQDDRISMPPRLWPNAMAVGDSWIVGPFQRLGLNQVGRMEVVAQESVTVPAGTYPDAFKVTGQGHVFAGTQLLKGGRLVTDHGTLETTTWFVPGLGPVREEAKLHIHQTYFPAAGAVAEVPLVVEERSTRSLAEFQLGR